LITKRERDFLSQLGVPDNNLDLENFTPSILGNQTHFEENNSEESEDDEGLIE